ncbi:DNA-binding protein, partial [Escherichia coli]|nr:DNA-binding protein [Escherichia coli]
MTNNSVSEIDFERFKNNVSNIIPVDEELRKNSILFSNGDFLFPAEDSMHPNVRFMREVALRKGIRHLKEFNVSIKIIRALYVKFEALSSRSDNLPMEIMAGRLITECANHKASDLHIKIEDSFA